MLPCPAIVELLYYIYLNFKLVKLYFHLFMQTLLVMESARANIFTAATKPYLFTLKYRQKNRNTQFIFLCCQCNLGYKNIWLVAVPVLTNFHVVQSFQRRFSKINFYFATLYLIDKNDFIFWLLLVWKETPKNRWLRWPIL